MKKRILSIALCLCMVLGLLPTAALAADATPPTVTLCGTTLESGKAYAVDGLDKLVEATDTAVNVNYFQYTATETDATLTVHGTPTVYLEEASTTAGLTVSGGTLTINTGETTDEGLTISTTTAAALSATSGAVILTGSGYFSLAASALHTVELTAASLTTAEGFAGLTEITNSNSTGLAIYTEDEDCTVSLVTEGKLYIAASSPAPTVGSAADVTLEGSYISLQNSGEGSLMDANGSISITATGADPLELSGSSKDSYLLDVGTGETITLSSAAALTLENTGSGNVLNGDLIVTRATDVTFVGDTGSAFPLIGGDVSITATGAVLIAGSVDTPLIDGDVTISAAGDVNVRNAVAATETPNGGAVSGTATITSTAGSIQITGNTTGPVISGTTASTLTAKKDITVTNAHTTAPALQTVSTLTADGIILIGGSDAANYVGRSNAYAYGGEIAGAGLDLYTAPTIKTRYLCGDGYALWEPTLADDGTVASGKLTLENFVCSTEGNNALSLPDLPGDITLELLGANSITATASNGNALKASTYGSLSILGDGSLTLSGAGYGLLYNGSSDDAVLTIGGSVCITANSIHSNKQININEGSTLNCPNVETNTYFGSDGTVNALVLEGMNDYYNMAYFYVYGDVTLAGNTTILDKSLGDGLYVNSGATLTIPAGTTLTVQDDAAVDGVPPIGNGGAIVNNGIIVLPSTYATDIPAAIADLKLTGSGTVKVGDAVYTNAGVAAHVTSGALDLTSGDHSAKTLAADGYTMTGDAASGYVVTVQDLLVGGLLTLPANTTLKLTGESTVNSAVLAKGDLTIEGDGALNVNTDQIAGIYAPSGSVTINSGTVNVTAITGAENDIYGIDAANDLTVTGGAVHVSVTATGETASACAISAGSSLSVSGGTVDVNASGTVMGIGLSASDMTLSGGSVTASAGNIAVYALSSLTLGDGVCESGGSTVHTVTTDSNPLYVLAAPNAEVTFGNLSTTSARSVTVTESACVMSVTLDKDHYNVTDTVTATVTVKAAESTQNVASIGFTLDYDKDALELTNTELADGWTTNNDDTTSLIGIDGASNSIGTDGITAATFTFKVNSDVEDYIKTAVKLTSPEIKLQDETLGFTPAVTGDNARLHNIVITLRPGDHATLNGTTGVITAYALYNQIGLFSDTARTQSFTMPTVAANAGYRLAAGTDDEYLWKGEGVAVTNNEIFNTVEIANSVDLTVQTVKVWTVTLSAAEHGSVTGSPLTLDDGATLLTALAEKATPDENYTFTGWYINDVQVTDATTVTADVTVEARFAPKTFSWSIVLDNCTISILSGVTDNKVAYGTDVTFKLTTLNGYVMNYVTYQPGGDMTQTISPDASGVYTVHGDAITGDLKVLTSTAALRTVTFQSSDAAAITSTTYYAKNDIAGLYTDEACTTLATALPTVTGYASGTGYQYRAPADTADEPGWKIGDTGVTGAVLLSQQTFTANATVTPNAVKQYLVTYAVDEDTHATVTVDGKTTAWFDENALLSTKTPTVSYTPGYVLDCWMAGNAVIYYWDEDAKNVPITKSLTVTLYTKKGIYGVTFPTVEGVTFTDQTGLTDNKATFGTDVTFKMTVATGYVVNSVSYRIGSGDTKTALTADNSGVYTIPGSSITDAVTVLVTSTQLHTVQFATGTDAHGTLSGVTAFYLADNASLTANQMSTITVTPDPGYQLLYWTMDGTQTDPTAVAVTGDVTFTAVFGQIDYTMTLPDDMTVYLNGSAQTGTQVTVHYGDTVFLDANKDSTIVSVSCKIGDGTWTELQRVGTIYTFPDGLRILGDVTFRVTRLSDKGFTLSFISADQYKALKSDTKIAVLTPAASAGSVTKVTMTDGTYFYWSSRYNAFVKIVSDDTTAASICGGLSFASGTMKNAIAYTGDINGDGSVTTADAAVANEILHATTQAVITDLMRLMCDVTDNTTTAEKVVTADDIMWILKHQSSVNS